MKFQNQVRTLSVRQCTGVYAAIQFIMIGLLKIRDNGILIASTVSVTDPWFSLMKHNGGGLDTGSKYSVVALNSSRSGEIWRRMRHYSSSVPNITAANWHEAAGTFWEHNLPVM